MPILTPDLEYLVVSVVTIVYGLRWERYYTAWISVVMNLVFTAILLGSTNLPTEVIYVLLVYIAIGILSAWRGWRTIFILFGTKTFGALSLTAALSQWSMLSWTHQLINSLRLNLGISAQEYLFSWVIIATIVHAIGFVFFRRRADEAGL